MWSNKEADFFPEIKFHFPWNGPKAFWFKIYQRIIKTILFYFFMYSRAKLCFYFHKRYKSSLKRSRSPGQMFLLCSTVMLHLIPCKHG